MYADDLRHSSQFLKTQKSNESCDATDLGVLAGALLQVLKVHLLGPLERLVVRLVNGLLQPEGVVAVDLLPIDGAIRAVHRLVPQLLAAGRAHSSANDGASAVVSWCMRLQLCARHVPPDRQIRQIPAFAGQCSRT